MAGGDLLGAARELAARQRFQHQRCDQPIPKQSDFLGLGIHPDDLLRQKHKAGGAPAPCKSCVFGFRRAALPGGAWLTDRLERRPAQQVESQIGEQEAVGGDPADGLQHLKNPGDEARRRRRGDQRCQSGAQAFGLLLETAYQNWPRW